MNEDRGEIIDDGGNDGVKCHYGGADDADADGTHICWC